LDVLTHHFLSLTVAYVLRPVLFDHLATLGLAGFGVSSEFEKFLGQPGLLHSLVTVCLVVRAFSIELSRATLVRDGGRRVSVVSRPMKSLCEDIGV